MADLHVKNADEDTVTEVGELDPSVIEAYWARVGETLRRVFNVASGDAKAAPKNYRFRAVVSARSYNSIPGGMRHP
jgi:hypothetical protein